jgi:hypothetical protein
MKSFILERLVEASTWRGIVLVLTAIGVPIAPQVADLIVSSGLGIAGLIGALTPDK